MLLATFRDAFDVVHLMFAQIYVSSPVCGSQHQTQLLFDNMAGATETRHQGHVVQEYIGVYMIYINKMIKSSSGGRVNALLYCFSAYALITLLQSLC